MVVKVVDSGAARHEVRAPAYFLFCRRARHLAYGRAPTPLLPQPPPLRPLAAYSSLGLPHGRRTSKTGRRPGRRCCCSPSSRSSARSSSASPRPHAPLGDRSHRPARLGLGRWRWRRRSRARCGARRGRERGPAQPAGARVDAARDGAARARRIMRPRCVRLARSEGLSGCSRPADRSRLALARTRRCTPRLAPVPRTHRCASLRLSMPCCVSSCVYSMCDRLAQRPPRCARRLSLLHPLYTARERFLFNSGSGRERTTQRTTLRENYPENYPSLRG